jgi:nitrate/nitrite-specific signal transduction histidine kinase
MTIEDNGAGLPPAAAYRREGQGLRIMAHRARMINAALEVRRGENGGTIVKCTHIRGKAEPLLDRL